jgi:serine/threonine protein kinase
MPNLCLVTEYMTRGSMKDILANKEIKLTWKAKLHMLKSAALGVNYLHSMHPCIIHRDLKVSHHSPPRRQV